MIFYDRHEAGRLLAAELSRYKKQKNTLVLGLARGGVVVAFEIAKALFLPLNVVVPRKVGAPGNPELALGSIMENGEGVFNHSIIQILGVPKSYITREIEKEKILAQQRLTLYRQYVPLPDIKHRTVILVDDGIATGSTMLTVIQAMRHAEAEKIVVAAPVASTEAMQLIEEAADETVCLSVREDFVGVGMYYRVFSQTENEEVIELLKKVKEHESEQL